jgi:hypothetical protein
MPRAASVTSLRLSLMDHGGCGTAECAVAPVPVVVDLEVSEHPRQVIRPSDERNTCQPFLLERLDNSLGHRDRAMLSHGAEALLHIPLLQQLPKGVAGEHAFRSTPRALWAVLLRGKPSRLPQRSYKRPTPAGWTARTRRSRRCDDPRAVRTPCGAHRPTEPILAFEAQG